MLTVVVCDCNHVFTCVLVGTILNIMCCETANLDPRAEFHRDFDRIMNPPRMSPVGPPSINQGPVARGHKYRQQPSNRDRSDNERRLQHNNRSNHNHGNRPQHRSHKRNDHNKYSDEGKVLIFILFF